MAPINSFLHPDEIRASTPLIGFRSTKYSVLKNPFVSVQSSGRPTWLTALRDLPGSELRDQCVPGSIHGGPFPLSGARRQCSADPDGALVPLRQELKSDLAPNARGERNGEERSRSTGHAQRNPPPVDRLRASARDRSGHQHHHGVMPFLRRPCGKNKLESTGANYH